MFTGTLRGTRSILRKLLCVLVLPAAGFAADHNRNFDTAIYIPVMVVRRLADPAIRQREWETISRQLKVDKVYIETERDRVLANEQTLEDLKKFFIDHGVRVAGGITYSDNTSGPVPLLLLHRSRPIAHLSRRLAELTARHFDEIILDDFFFVNTKYRLRHRRQGQPLVDAVPPRFDGRGRG